MRRGVGFFNRSHNVDLQLVYKKLIAHKLRYMLLTHEASLAVDLVPEGITVLLYHSFSRRKTRPPSWRRLCLKLRLLDLPIWFLFLFWPLYCFFYWHFSFLFLLDGNCRVDYGDILHCIPLARMGYHFALSVLCVCLRIWNWERD